MSKLRHRSVTNIVLLGLCAVCAVSALASETKVLVKPQDDEIIDELEVGGTTTEPLSGVSRMRVPDSDTTYYIVDRRKQFEKRVYEYFSNLHRYDSDISIHHGFVVGQFYHIQLNEKGIGEVIFITGKPEWLYAQLFQLFREGLSPESGATLNVAEYRFAMDDCVGLSGHVSGILSSLQQSAAMIGVRPPPKEFIVLDGIYYDVTIRMQDGAGRFGVGENNNALFEPVHATVRAIRECAESGIEPTVFKHVVTGTSTRILE